MDNLVYAPALALGVTTGSALRGLVKLAQRVQVSDDHRHSQWSARATAGILGQLAVTHASTNQKILNATHRVARSSQTLRGLESVLLSSLLGSPEGTRDEAAAAEVWAQFGGARESKTGSAVLNYLPILSPDSGTFAFLDLRPLRGAAGSGDLRNMLKAQFENPPQETDVDADVDRWALAIVVSAAVTALARPAVVTGGGPGPALASGAALLVDAVLSRPEPLLADGNAPSGAVSPSWPMPTVGDLTQPLQHAFWTTARSAESQAPTGPGLTALLVHTNGVITIAALPAMATSGAFVRRGFLPAEEAVRTPPKKRARFRPLNLARNAEQEWVEIVLNRSVDLSGVPEHAVSYALPTHPLTGKRRPGPVYYVPGFEPSWPISPPHPPPVRGLLANALRNLALPVNERLDAVIERAERFGKRPGVRSAASNPGP